MNSNGMKRNTIIFGDNENSSESNIDKIDRLVIKKSRESTLEKQSKGVISFGGRNVSFSNPINDNIKRIDALVEAKSRESYNIKEVDSKKFIKENTIVFGDVGNSTLVGKKYIRRGKINIKNGYSDIDDGNDEEALELREIKSEPIIDNTLETIDNSSEEVSGVEDKIDNGVKANNKKIDVMLIIIMVLLVLILFVIGFFVFLLSYW